MTIGTRQMTMQALGMAKLENIHFDDPENAIKREKRIKKWNREWKLNLIEANNPDWDDLYEKIV